MSHVIKELNSRLDKQFYRMLGKEMPVQEGKDTEANKAADVKTVVAAAKEYVDSKKKEGDSKTKIKNLVTIGVRKAVNKCCANKVYSGEVEKEAIEKCHDHYQCCCTDESETMSGKVLREYEEVRELAAAYDDGDEDRAAEILDRIDPDLPLAREVRDWLESSGYYEENEEDEYDEIANRNADERYGPVDNEEDEMDDYDNESPRQEIQDGDKVKFTGAYDDGSGEVFTASQCDDERQRCWVGDAQNRGWYAHYSDLKVVKSGSSFEDDEDEDGVWESTKDTRTPLEEGKAICKSCKGKGVLFGKPCKKCCGEEECKEDSVKKEEEKEVQEAAVDATVWKDTPDESTKDTPEEAKEVAFDGAKMEVPARILTALKTKAAEFRKMAETYRYDRRTQDHYNNVAKAMEEIEMHLAKRTQLGYQEAQMFYQTLMNLITTHIPADVVLFLAGGGKRDLGSYFKEVRLNNNR